MNILNLVLAVLLPPLGVGLQVGISKHFWINLILCLCGYVPGIVHGVWVVASGKTKPVEEIKE